MKRVAVVTGGSSGIGESTAAMLADRGYVVYDFSRFGSDTPVVHHLPADVTQTASLAAAFRSVYEAEGSLDLLVCNAGMGISGAVEFTTDEAAQRQFDVNFFGVFRSIREALPYLRKSDDAHIVAVSSVAAPLSIPFQAFYSASKAAINSLVLALANELRPAGIRVSAVMPGDVHTGFTAARQKSAAGAPLYGGRIQKAVGAMEKDEQGGMTPAYVASVICRVAQKKHPRVLYTAGAKYRVFVVIDKLLPVDVCNRLVGKLYG
ncbi:MAG: SDR family NAD(P)-dependent oxidoreductase [Oscillospiraceae bacterium]|nr:SDR family NAD(P)-dependent oxidoreductase [Oscillospiraceae bacterium]